MTTPRRWPRLTALVVAAGLVASGVVACSNDDQAVCPPLALAFLGVLSGPDGSSGSVVRNSAAMAVDEHNEANPDCPVGLITYDSQGQAEVATVLARQIVADPQIIAVVGPVYSGESLAVLPIFEAAGLPVLSPSATNPTLSEQGWSMFHRVVGTDDAQGPAGVAWLVQNARVDTVAVVDDGTVFGKALADFAIEELDRRGLTIAPRQQVEPGRLDYSDVVARIAGVGVDAVYYGGLGESAARLQRQLLDAGVQGLFVGGDGMFTAAFLDAMVLGPGGGASVVVTCPCAGSATTPEQRAFVERYRTRYNAEPIYFAFEGFDAASMLLAGIDSGARTRTALADWLDDATFTGLSKTISFEPNGDVIGGPVFVNRIEGNQFVTVARVIDGRVSAVG